MPTLDPARVVAAQAGDDEALSDVLSAVRHRAYRYAGRVLRSYHGGAELAEDVAQETAVAVWQALPEFTFGAVPFDVLVWFIIKNKTADQQRRHARSREHLDRGDQHIDDTDHAPGPEHVATVRADQAAALKVLDLLRPDDARILLLRGEGFTVDECAALLDVTPNALRVRHHRATARLKVLLDGQP